MSQAPRRALKYRENIHIQKLARRCGPTKLGELIGLAQKTMELNLREQKFSEACIAAMMQLKLEDVPAKLKKKKARSPFGRFVPFASKEIHYHPMQGRR